MKKWAQADFGDGPCARLRLPRCDEAQAASPRARWRAGLPEERQVLDKWKSRPVVADPGVVDHAHALAVEVDLKESGRTEAGRVTQEGSARVQAELVGQVGRNESPGRVHVAAAIEVRTNPL